MDANIENLIRDGCSIVDVDKAAHKAVGPSDIRVNRECFDEVMKSNEIRMAIDKRFNTKGTLYLYPGFRELVAWCLGTDSYKLCEKNLEKVSNKDIDLAWQFIDTTAVSSTKHCREVMDRYRGGRSSVGFRREHMRPYVTSAPRRQRRRNMVLPTLASYTERDCEGYGSLEDVMLEDCMHWILSSPDPTSSALHLRSRLLEGNKGRSDLGGHRGQVRPDHRFPE